MVHVPHMRNNIMKEISFPIERISVRAFLVVTFSILTAIGAQIEIPNYPVPFTFQTFFVLSAGAFLGKRDGTISMGLYLLLGSLGLPIFSGGLGGFARIVGPTGGYLLAFPMTAFVVGFLLEFRREYWWIVLSMTIGSFIFFALGTLHLYLVYTHQWTHAFQAGFLIFSWWDAIKIISAAAIAHHYFRRITLP
jgi:biotin transport system substrate-specific component